MRKLLPLVLILLGLGGGAAAGFVLRPQPRDMAEVSPCGDAGAAPAADDVTPEVSAGDREYVRMNNQFVIPVIEERRIAALVVMSLSLEVPLGQKEQVFAREPKLRDVFLQVLFDHANVGGFDGAFTSSTTLDRLRSLLREAANTVIDGPVSDVLITDIARQDN